MEHEIKKAALRQTSNGTLITFVLHPSEDTSELVNSPIGQCYLATFKPTDGGEEGEP